MSDDGPSESGTWDPRPQILPDSDAKRARDADADESSGDDDSDRPDDTVDHAVVSVDHDAESELVAVLVELDESDGPTVTSRMTRVRNLGDGFTVDDEFEIVPMQGGSFVARGWVPRAALASLEARPDVVAVWSDTPIEPFQE